MEIVRAADRARQAGPADWFTGRVELRSIAPPEALLVTFKPGARTAWHTHPCGQALHIVSGVARVGRDDGTVEELHPGDLVTFAAGERHWHGAGPDAEMAHVAIARTAADARPADWQAHVTDIEYGA